MATNPSLNTNQSKEEIDLPEGKKRCPKGYIKIVNTNTCRKRKLTFMM